MNIDKMFPKGILRPELFMGVISSVSAYAAKVNLSEAGTPSGSHFSGGRYGKGEVGEFVIVEGQTNLLLGRLVEVKLPELERKIVNQSYSGARNLDAIGTIQLLGSISMESMKVQAGVDGYPRIGDRVYSAPHRFVSQIPTFMDIEADDEKSVSLNIGFVDKTQESQVSIKPEKLFGRHCAVLGATGGGKSWTTARLLEECIKFNSKVILLDATGEYRNLIGEKIKHVHLGETTNSSKDSNICSLPPTAFIESDFIALFEPAGKVQGPKLRAAIRSLRLAGLKPELASNGFIVKINQSKTSIELAEKDPRFSPLLDDPRQPFDVKQLVPQIEQECVYPEGFGKVKGEKDTTKWGGEDGNFSHCLSLISRINAILTSPAFKCVFNSSEKSITSFIDEFLDSDERLLIISVSGIAYEFKAREIIANSIGRDILIRARKGKFENHPLLLFVDEAHNFLGRNLGSDDYVSRLDAFELIAKEGRKYGLNICLTTQRPRDITEGVLSQVGALIVHRLTNDKDREVVERACGEIDRSASAFLPNLKPGEAAIIGADFPIPLTVKIQQPTIPPKSDGPNYQKSWKSKDG